MESQGLFVQNIDNGFGESRDSNRTTGPRNIQMLQLCLDPSSLYQIKCQRDQRLHKAASVGKSKKPTHLSESSPKKRTIPPAEISTCSLQSSLKYHRNKTLARLSSTDGRSRRIELSLSQNQKCSAIAPREKPHGFVCSCAHCTRFRANWTTSVPPKILMSVVSERLHATSSSMPHSIQEMVREEITPLPNAVSHSMSLNSSPSSSEDISLPPIVNSSKSDKDDFDSNQELKSAIPTSVYDIFAGFWMKKKTLPNNRVAEVSQRLVAAAACHRQHKRVKEQQKKEALLQQKLARDDRCKYCGKKFADRRLIEQQGDSVRIGNPSSQSAIAKTTALDSLSVGFSQSLSNFSKMADTIAGSSLGRLPAGIVQSKDDLSIHLIPCHHSTTGYHSASTACTCSFTPRNFPPLINATTSPGCSQQEDNIKQRPLVMSWERDALVMRQAARHISAKASDTCQCPTLGDWPPLLSRANEAWAEDDVLRRELSLRSYLFEEPCFPDDWPNEGT